MGKESFVFYRSFYEALQNVPKKNRAEVYEAVFTYVFESREPSVSGVTRALWELIRPQLDASQKRYDNAKKGAEYGKMGGRPKKKEENKKPLKGYESETLNVNVNENENVNVNENENVNVNVAHAREQTDNLHSPDSLPTGHQTGRPTNDEIYKEMMRNNYQMTESSFNRFMAYNDERGWKIPLADALRKWNELEKSPSPVSAKKPTGKKNFLNNGMQRTGAEKQANDELKAKLIAMQGG